MGHRSEQQYTTLSLTFISSSECIAWLTVYGIEAVGIIVLNALTAIIYLKVHSLRKHSMYLVISLAVADMFIGGLLIFDGWFLGRDCNFWTSDLNRPSNIVVIALCRLVPLASLTNLAAISLERTHATFRPFAHDVAKKKIFGAAVVAVWMTAGLSSTISGINIYLAPLLKRSHFFYVSYLKFYSLCLLVFFCVLHVYSYKNYPWKSITSSWCKQQRNETHHDTVHCDSCITTAYATLYHFRDSFFSVTHYAKQFNNVSVKFFFCFII